MKKRISSEKRKEQIINITLKLILQNGLSGTTIARIASGVGVTEPAIYRHFKNRREILMVALDEVFARLFGHLLILEKEQNIISRLRQTSAMLYKIIMDHPEEPKLLFEFICAPPREDLREPIQKRFLSVLEYSNDVLRKGIENGSLREDLDVNVTSWKMFSLGITLYLASFLGFDQALSEETAFFAVESILHDITKTTDRSLKRRKEL